MKENILFLEEWIDYHLALGFDKFFLYDNSKVQKKSPFDTKNLTLVPSKINKYGINYDDIVKLTNDQINEITEKLKKKYKNILYIKEWSPKDADGIVCYNQEEAHEDCLKTLKKNKMVGWCASIDIDEFIILDNGKKNNIKKFIGNLKKDVTNIKMSQRRFDSRFNNLGSLVTSINKGEKNNIRKSHSVKYIYKVETAHSMRVHSCGGKKEIHPDLKKISFNHYKINFNNGDTWEKYGKILNTHIHPDISKRLLSNSKNYIIKDYKCF